MNFGEYECVGQLGVGSFATVYKVQRDGVEYACKVMKLIQKREHFSSIIRNEVRVMHELYGTGAIQLYDAFKDNAYVFLVMELCKTNLSQLLIDYVLDEQQIKIWFKEFLLTLRHVHSMKIAHRDIKPDNRRLSIFNSAKKK